MHAYRLRQVDKQQSMHLQAWLNHQVTSTKEQGKKQIPVYKDFKEFFDYEKLMKEIESDSGNQHKLSEKHKELAKIAKRLNERR